MDTDPNARDGADLNLVGMGILNEGKMSILPSALLSIIPIYIRYKAIEKKLWKTYLCG